MPFLSDWLDESTREALREWVFPPIPPRRGLVISVVEFTWGVARWLLLLGCLAYAINLRWTYVDWGVLLAAIEATHPQLLWAVFALCASGWLAGILTYHVTKRAKVVLEERLEPGISIECDPANPACAEDETWSAVVANIQVVRRTRRIRIEARGTQSISNVRVVLDDIQPGGGWSKPLRERSDDPSTITQLPFQLSFQLNPGEPLFFDVARTSTEFGFAPSGHFAWRYAEHDFPAVMPFGTYRVVILVTGDNIPPSHRRLQLVASDNELMLTAL